MSEAYQNLRPTITRMGTDMDLDTFQVRVSQKGLDLHIPNPISMWGSTRRWFWSSVGKLGATVYPVPLSVVVSFAASWCVYSRYAPEGAFIHTNPMTEKLMYLDSFLNPLFLLTPPQLREPLMWAKNWTILLSASTVLHRFATRRLLRFKGWLLNKNVEKPGWRTRLWSSLTKLFVHPHGRTDNYERCLPSVPLPYLQQTVSKFIARMRPIFAQDEDPEDWLQIVKASEEFLANEGPVLQRHLRLHHVVSPNYVTDWYTRNVFLASRAPLSPHGSFYIVPFADYKPTKKVESRAAVIVHELVKLKFLIERKKLEPDFTGPKNCVPLTMDQYLLAFNTTRIPGREVDIIEQESGHETNYIIVLLAGRIFQMSVLHPRTHRPLTPLQLERIFVLLRREVEDELSTGRDSSEEDSEEELPEEKAAKKRSYRIAESLLPALTTAPRSEWADIRMNYFLNDSVNKLPLRTIEKALFVVSIEEELTRSKRKDAGLSSDCAEFLCGNGSNLWCDKSFNVIIRSDCQVGVHVEHSWCDPTTFLSLFERVSQVERKNGGAYDQNGQLCRILDDRHVLTPEQLESITPRRLRFNIHKSLAKCIRDTHTNYLVNVVSQVQVEVKHYTTYGASLPRRCNLSPNSWMQMAIQLAHYMDQDYHASQVYESIPHRIYLKGRTEAVRSVTDKSQRMVRAFTGRNVHGAPEEKQYTPEELREMVVEACEEHSSIVQGAIAGQGIERHLFALHMIGSLMLIPSEFITLMMRKTKFRVSTSFFPQPMSLLQFLGAKAKSPAEYGTPCCGFGPVSADGYGVAYTFVGEESLYYTVTGVKGDERASCSRFASLIEEALNLLASQFDASVEATSPVKPNDGPDKEEKNANEGEDEQHTLDTTKEYAEGQLGVASN